MNGAPTSSSDRLASSLDGTSVFVTGHTGFKGAWLSRWLRLLGAQVHGYALAPEPYQTELFRVVEASGTFETSTIGDLDDRSTMADAFAAAQPHIVLHLAAQPLVRASYDDPTTTFRTNVLGTAHVLDLVREHRTPAVLCVTSDKCYDNREQLWSYREIDPVGGWDPYSASKGAAELVIESYRRSFFTSDSGVLCASARAGNVIGGGDFSPDRLVPDFFRAVESGTTLVIRRPTATRPWQHVLESLSGYLVLASELHRGNSEAASAWNFGPHTGEVHEVRVVIDHLVDLLGPAAPLVVVGHDGPHEATRLSLDISKAQQLLGWSPALDIGRRLRLTADWYTASPQRRNEVKLLDDQIRAFEHHWSAA